MKKVLLAALLAAFHLAAMAQEQDDYKVRIERLDSVVVSTTRAGTHTPVTHTSVDRDFLRSSNPINSLPMTLSLLPSVVTYNEGGTGLGNSAMTIRGVKGSQINVTLNGVTLNDAESQEVFWVNIPAMTSLISNVQVQRGLGTSASGAGSFGASLNMNTAFVTRDSFSTYDLSYGSYNTLLGTVSASTGLSSDGFYASAAFSYGRTDGYIRNAWVNSHSAFLVMGWLKGIRSLRFTYLMGDQHSGITWDGIDLEQYAKDRRYNGAGKYTDANGQTAYYDNQSDNYSQHHFQVNYTHSYSPSLYWTSTLNYTHGSGYDEYYKTGRKLVNFGFTDAGDLKSDMIYRKAMGNDLFVANTDLRYHTRSLVVNTGLSASYYYGSHYGRPLWVRDSSAADLTLGEWYSNRGEKVDFSAFARAEYRPIPWLTAYADLQFRLITYDFTGKDDDWLEYGSRLSDLLDYHTVWPFFNPKAGISAIFGGNTFYASAALGHREPGRSDIKENIKGEFSPISPETMLDVEAGWRYSGSKLSASANIYAMEYRNMLLETGRLSSSGYAIKENVDRAWRRGIELAAGVKILPWLRADANSTFSVNRIANYSSYIPYDDYSGRHYVVDYGEAQMLMSPSYVGMARLTANPWKGGNIIVSGKYVGKQYIDNSSRDEMAIPAYFVADASLSHSFTVKRSYREGRGIPITASVFVNNFLNNMYYAAGWRWESYHEADPSVPGDTSYFYSGIGVYPQAPLNFMFKLSTSF